MFEKGERERKERWKDRENGGGEGFNSTDYTCVNLFT